MTPDAEERILRTIQHELRRAIVRKTPLIITIDPSMASEAVSVTITHTDWADTPQARVMKFGDEGAKPPPPRPAKRRAPAIGLGMPLGRPRPRQPQPLGRIGYSVTEASYMLGERADALRRRIENHAQAEGDELIARLNGGVVARKRNGQARWLIIIPNDLMRGE